MQAFIASLLIPILFPILKALLGLALAWLLVHATLLIREHVKNQRAQNVLINAIGLLNQAVAWGAQTIVDSAKAKGTWDSSVAADVKNQVIKRWQQMLTTDGVTSLAKALGFDSVTDGGFTTTMDTLTEAAVKNHATATALATQLNAKS